MNDTCRIWEYSRTTCLTYCRTYLPRGAAYAVVVFGLSIFDLSKKLDGDLAHPGTVVVQRGFNCCSAIICFHCLLNLLSPDGAFSVLEVISNPIRNVFHPSRGH